MIEIRNIKTIDGNISDHFIESKENRVIDGSSLLLLPALIDPHVHFRTPGEEYKENWQSAAKAAVYGGVTTVFDMPNNHPLCTNFKKLSEKKKHIEQQLKQSKIPIRYYFYLGADTHALEEIEACKEEIIGVKLSLGSSTGNFFLDDEKMKAVFALCATLDLPVAFFGEDENIVFANRKKLSPPLTYKDHSLIKSPKAAAKALQKAIDYSAEYGTKIYALHVSTKEEIRLLKGAKEKNIPIYAQATPHHLFLTDSAYENWEGKALVDPPLRSQKDVDALWNGVEEGIIDCIGSAHAPHTEEEKRKPYGATPSGMPGVQTTLPLLLNAYHKKRLTLRQIVDLTNRNIHNIFNFPANDDVVLVDLHLKKRVEKKHLHTKVRWSCFEGTHLVGWPVYTIVKGKVFNCENT